MPPWGLALSKPEASGGVKSRFQLTTWAFRNGKDSPKPPRLFLLHQAFKSADTFLDCRQFSRCSGMGSPLRIPSLEGIQGVFNPPDQFVGIRLYQGQFVGFSPGMRYASHRGPLALSDELWTLAGRTLRARTEGKLQ